MGKRDRERVIDRERVSAHARKRERGRARHNDRERARERYSDRERARRGPKGPGFDDPKPVGPYVLRV